MNKQSVPEDEWALQVAETDTLPVAETEISCGTTLKQGISLSSSHSAGLRLLIFGIVLGVMSPAQVLTGSAPTGGGPNQTAVNPVTGKIYVTNDDGSISIVDGSNGGSVTLPNQVGSLFVINTATNKIYTEGPGSAITVIDGTTDALTSIATSSTASYTAPIAVNTVTNKIYCLSPNNTLTILDGSTNALTFIQVPALPSELALDPVRNKIYLASANSTKATIIDGLSNAITTVDLGTPSSYVSVNPLTNNIYFSGKNGNVIVLDGNSHSTTTLNVAGSGPIIVNPVTNKVYELYQTSNLVYAIDGPTNKIDQITLPWSGSYSMALNSKTNKIYVAAYNNILVIDGSTDLVTSIPASLALYVSVDPVRDRVYASNYFLNTASRADCGTTPTRCNTLSFVDAATPTTVTVRAGVHPTAVAIDPVANKAYVLDNNSNAVTAIDGVNATTTNVPTGTLPIALTNNPIIGKTYIANQGSKDITVLDDTSNTTITVPIGTQPGAIVANPVTNKVYVANPAVVSGQITILDGLSNTPTTLSLGAGVPASQDIAVNPATNRIYVETASSIVVVDGATDALTTLPLSIGTGLPIGGLAINPLTNKIYVVSNSGITVIDGISNATSAVGLSVGTPQYVQVNTITNKIYVAGTGSVVAVVDGSTGIVTPVSTTSAASGLFVNESTNKIYDLTASTLTVIDGIFNSATMVPLPAAGTGLAVNPLADQIYVSVGSNSTVVIISDRMTEPTSVAVAITPLPANQTTSSAPAFTFNAASNTGTTPTAVYYQVDTWQKAWTAATGSNPTFSATLATLSPGIHTIYAFATDDLSATYAEPFTSTIGAIQAYTFLISQPQGSSVVPTTGTPFVTAQSLSSLRNNYSGFVGFEFTVGSSAVQVSSLGRYVAPGNSGTHLLKLVQANGTDVAGASATLAINTAAGQYQYAALISPVTLAANTTYYLVSAESAGGDQWYDISGVTAASAGAILAPVYTDGFGTYVPVPGLAGKSYVPLNFLFSTGSTTPPPPPPPTTTTGTSFVTAQTPGPQRNNYTGSVGYTFTVTQAVTVTALGRYVAPGNAGSHLLQLVSVDGSGSITPLASASAALAGATAGQFDYVTLGSSVTLQPGVTYYLTSQETAGGDNWYDIGGVSVTAGTVLAPVYTDGTGRYVPVSGLSGKGYVPVSFLYASSGTTPPPPTTTATALITGQTASTLRNNFGGFVGTALQVGATPLTVTSLGRFDVAGNSGTHTVKLVQANGTDVPGGSVTINLAGATAGQYTYATLSAPVTLQANTTYYLVGQETSGGDKWYDLEPVTTTSAAQVLGAVYVDGSGKYVMVSGLAGYSYGPLNLQYQ